MSWYLAALKKYTDFDGRARRKEYWMFALFNFLAIFALASFDTLLGTMGSRIGLLSGLYCLVIFLPSLAVAIRRLHDTNRTGWWVLFGIVPIVGAIVLLIFNVLDSQPGTNRFGISPKETLA